MNVDSVFKESDSITLNVLITHFEDFITEKETKCIGRSIQERIELINSNQNKPNKINVEYADSILNPKTISEARKIRKFHNADFLIYGLVTIKDDTCNFKNLKFRLDIDESLTAKSPVIKINPTKHDNDKLLVNSPEKIIEGKLEIGGISIDSWIIALADLKFDNPDNAFLELDSRITNPNLDSIERSKLCSQYGKIYSIQKHWKRSIISYDMSIKLNPVDTISYYKKGASLKKIEKHEEAIIEYNKALALDSCYADAYYGRGVAYQHLDEIDLAINDLEKAIELNPKDVDFPIYLGYTLSKNGKYKEGMVYHDIAVSLDSLNYEAYLYRAIANKDYEKNKMALEDFNKAISIDSTNAMAYNSRGILLKNLKKYEEALNDYNKSIFYGKKSCDLCTQAYFNRGYLYFLLGKHKKAVEDLKRYNEFNPDDIDGLYYYGLVLRKLRKFEESKAVFKKASRINHSEHKHLFFRKAQSHYFLKDYSKAIQYYDSTIALDSTKAILYNMRADAQKNSEKSTMLLMIIREL